MLEWLGTRCRPVLTMVNFVFHIVNAATTRKEIRYDHRRCTRYNEVPIYGNDLVLHLVSCSGSYYGLASYPCWFNSCLDALDFMAAECGNYDMSGHFTDCTIKKIGEKLYLKCKYKGTFVNCGPFVCLSCHRDSMKEIAQKMNKLWYVRIWKWCIRRKKYLRLLKYHIWKWLVMERKLK